MSKFMRSLKLKALVLTFIREQRAPKVAWQELSNLFPQARQR